MSSKFDLRIFNDDSLRGSFQFSMRKFSNPSCALNFLRSRFRIAWNSRKKWFQVISGVAMGGWGGQFSHFFLPEDLRFFTTWKCQTDLEISEIPNLETTMFRGEKP